MKWKKRNKSGKKYVKNSRVMQREKVKKIYNNDTKNRRLRQEIEIDIIKGEKERYRNIRKETLTSGKHTHTK